MIDTKYDNIVPNLPIFKLFPELTKDPVIKMFRRRPFAFIMKRFQNRSTDPEIPFPEYLCEL